MQDLMNITLGEMRRDEYQHQAAQVNADAWQYAHRHPYRISIAKALIALASRLAPVLPAEQPAMPTQLASGANRYQ
jgi:hypothetical protein